MPLSRVAFSFRALPVSLLLLLCVDRLPVYDAQPLGNNDIAPCPNIAVIPPPPLQRLDLEFVRRDLFCCLLSEEPQDLGDEYPFQQSGCPRRLDVESFCRAAETLPSVVKRDAALVPEGPTVVGVGSTGLCFNVFVAFPYIPIESCFNGVIGAPDYVLRDLSEGASMVAAGDAVLVRSSNAAASFEGKCIVGGNLSQIITTEVPSTLTVCEAVNDPCESQSLEPFEGSGIWIGGRVNPNRSLSEGITFSIQGLTAASFSDPADYDQFVATELLVLTEQLRRSGREQIEAKTCSAAHQLMALPLTGEVTDTEDLVIRCDDQTSSAVCIVEISADQLAFAETIQALIMNNYDQVVIRVTGSGEINFVALTAPTTPNILFFFPDAHAVNMQLPFDVMGGSINCPIFAPFATTVSVHFFSSNVALVGPIITGNPGSTVVLKNFVTDLRTGTRQEILPEPLRREFGCSCACKPEDLPYEIETPSCLEKKTGKK